MKVRLELELDMATGDYDVKFKNLSHPGENIDVLLFAKLVDRVLAQVRLEPGAWSSNDDDAPSAAN